MSNVRDELQQWVDGVDATHEDGLADLTHDVIPVDLARTATATATATATDGEGMTDIDTTTREAVRAARYLPLVLGPTTHLRLVHRHLPTLPPLRHIRQRETNVNILSLFSGIGGLEIGLERAGMTTVGQVEIDPYCQRVLTKHWPDVPRHNDVRTTVEWWESESRPHVDIICGGPPCQDISNAGKQAGITGERSGLWKAMWHTIRHLRPDYVLIENVAALAIRGLDVVLADLASIGFDAQWATLRASDFGAPHNRERIYIVAYPSCVDGQSRDLLGASTTRRAPFAVGGLSGLAASECRRAAREWLEREPDVARLAHGIPSQVDRLRVLGNAVVPQVSEHIGRQIMASLQQVAS